MSIHGQNHGAQRRHATTPEQRQEVLDGAIETWRIERAFKGIMADAMAACAER